MTDPAPPGWVSKRDGRLVPFEADRVSRALFAATEGLGRPDPFLARELADGAVHFLAEDCAGIIPTTQRIAEVVVQVVRELGHPALARAFAEHRKSRPAPVPPRSLADALAEAARAYSLKEVYTRDLAAAVEAGLITLAGLDTPSELAGCVLGAPRPLSGDLVEDLEHLRRFAGQYVALDGLEFLPGGGVVDSLKRGLERVGLVGVVNLNVSSPPPWATSLADGPLFASPDEMGQAKAKCDELLAGLLGTARVDWHLSLSDFDDRERLISLLGTGLSRFVFDRPRRPVALAEGLTRAAPAALLVAGLRLPALAEQPGMLADADRFVQRLGSLARLALSAAVQKRSYLRRQPRPEADVTSGFLLDRARLVAVPIGLDDVVRRFTGWGMSNGGESLEFGRRVLRRLADVLREDGRHAHLETCLDGSPTLEAEADETASPRNQVRAATEYGTLSLFVAEETLSQIAELLELAYRQTDAVRVRLIRRSPEQRELFGTNEVGRSRAGE